MSDDVLSLLVGASPGMVAALTLTYRLVVAVESVVLVVRRAADDFAEVRQKVDALYARAGG